MSRRKHPRKKIAQAPVPAVAVPSPADQRAKPIKSVPSFTATPVFQSRSATRPAVFPLFARRPGVWRVAFLMTAVLFALLLLDNRQYLFNTRLHENADQASNSLFVREAEQGVLLHGHYSRWRFYHPGPALLDTLAAGEALFYHKLHLVPTPFNGQLITLCLALTLFLGLALSVFARQLGSGRGGYLFFLPLALFFAIWHYSAIGGSQIFLIAWPAYTLIPVFLCFVVTVAATASGGGWALPVLVLAGGWLVHNHVAQPIFVAPLTLLAYGGLLAACWRQRGDAAAGTHRGIGWLSAAWRAFPRAHWVATALLSLFVLPLALDALQGGDSNLNRILDHLRTNHDPGKNLARSLCYFLIFGSDTTYQPGRADFGHYSLAGMRAFVGLHWRIYALWASALLGAPALLFAARRTSKPHPVSGDRKQESFLPWFYVVLAVTVGLTLVWGMKQDGEMFFFNAFFNYSIYLCAALGFAAALAVALMAWTQQVPAVRGTRLAICALLWVSVAGTAVYRKDSFQASSAFASAADNVMADTVERAAATLPKNAVCFVDCQPWESWPTAIAVALDLERLGHPVRVSDNWDIMFGQRHTIQAEPIDAATPLKRWVVVPESEKPARLRAWPLLPGYVLDMKELPDVNPAGQSIVFSKDGNYKDFAFFGWSASDSSWTWSDQRTAMLAFHPLPLPGDASAGVDLLISAWSFLGPDKSKAQQAVIQFNDWTLAVVDLPPDGPALQPLRVRITPELWQSAVAKGEARLQFLFPDAASPASLGLGADHRLLGGGFHSIEFRPAAAGVDPAQPKSSKG